jgi:hypothetical protein
MANLPALSSPGVFGLTKVERQASKEIARARVGGSVLAARESAKIEALTEVAETALLSAAEVSSLEGLLVMRTPHAAGRLGYVADRACMAMGNVVAQLGRRL